MEIVKKSITEIVSTLAAILIIAGTLRVAGIEIDFTTLLKMSALITLMLMGVREVLEGLTGRDA